MSLNLRFDFCNTFLFKIVWQFCTFKEYLLWSVMFMGKTAHVRDWNATPETRVTYVGIYLQSLHQRGHHGNGPLAVRLIKTMVYLCFGSRQRHEGEECTEFVVTTLFRMQKFYRTHLSGVWRCLQTSNGDLHFNCFRYQFWIECNISEYN